MDESPMKRMKTSTDSPLAMPSLYQLEQPAAPQYVDRPFPIPTQQEMFCGQSQSSAFPTLAPGVAPGVGLPYNIVEELTADSQTYQSISDQYYASTSAPSNPMYWQHPTSLPFPQTQSANLYPSTSNFGNSAWGFMDYHGHGQNPGHQSPLAISSAARSYTRAPPIPQTQFTGSYPSTMSSASSNLTSSNHTWGTGDYHANNSRNLNPNPIPQALSASAALSSTHIFTTSVAERFLRLELALCEELMQLEFPEIVTHVYNPLDYARDLHWSFLKRYCQTEKPVLFLGMNPGPFGMAQTGVPFGEVGHVKNWMGLSGTVKKPANEHPKKPIWGLDCPRKEVSGARFWGYFQKVCGTPETFFNSCFVHNFCPLIFMSATGKNVTPPDMKVAYRHPLTQACDRSLCAIVRLLKPKMIIGIGKFAELRTTLALKGENIQGIDVRVIMHPSPANPAANKGWEPVAHQQLLDMGLLNYFVKKENPWN